MTPELDALKEKQWGNEEREERERERKSEAGDLLKINRYSRFRIANKLSHLNRRLRFHKF